MALKFRRGTTAQQSGSLVFGEPYVNTTLGTLIIGGATGDIVLSTSGTGSTGNFGAISGSGLDITGNANIAGNLTLGGTITIGDANTDNVVVNADLSSSLIPNNDNAFDLGSNSARYRAIYGTNIYGAINSTNGVVSGSSQIVLQSTTGFTAYDTNLSTITGSLILSASVDRVSITNLNTFSASENSKAATLATYTGSNDTTNTTQNTRLTALESSASTALLTNNTQDTKFTTLGTYTASVETRFGTLATYTGSNDTTNTTQNTRLTALESSTGSLNSFSASANTRFTEIGVVSGSLINSASTLTQRVSAIESVSGTFARTNSANTLNGTQTISGSLFVTQDLVVQGSSSIQNISSSNLVIGAAYVTLNTNTPSSRYAGLTIIDSGSGGGSSSLWYDAVQDEFIQVHKGNGLNVTSSHFVQGPQTYDNLGNELYLTNNRLTKGTGLEHIVDSQISDDGTTVSIPGALAVTGNITGPIRATNGVVSGSSQIVYASISSIPAGIVSGAVQITPLLPTGVVSGSSQVVGSAITTNTITIGSTSTALGGTSTTLAGLTSVTSTGFTGALTGNASTATTLQTARLINGASFNGSADITIANLVSGSSQIDATATTNFATGVKTQLNSNTVVSGSSQIAFSGVTGTVSNAQLANSTISGVSLGSNLSTLTIGTGLSGTSYNGSGAVTIANTGVLSITSNTGLSSNVSATGAVTITNTGVTSNVGSTGISLSANTGAVTITNTGVTSAVAGTAISVSGATGAVTINNTGVTSNVAGTGVSVSGATGAVTISIGQSVATTATPTFGNLTINGTITATGDITAFFTSDKRHKNNIQTIANAVLKVKQLNGVTWQWNDDVSEVTKSTPKTGLIAQEVQMVLPQVVIERADGFLALDYSKMVGLLVEAIKEQQLQIDELKSKIGSR